MPLNVGELFATMRLNVEGVVESSKIAQEHIKLLEAKIGTLEGAMKGAGSSASGFFSEMKKGFAEGLGISASVGVAMVAAKLAEFAVEAVRASDAAEITGRKVRVIFGENANVVAQWAENSAVAMNRTSDEIKGLMAQAGSLTVSLTGNREAALHMSEGMTELAVSMSKLGYGNAADVMEKVRAGVYGADKALLALGITINDDEIKQEALRWGMSKSVKDMSDAEKAVLRYNIMLDKMKGQQDVAKDSGDSLSEQWQTLKNTFDDVAQALGDTLKPALVSTIGLINDAIRAAQGFGGALSQWIYGDFRKTLAAGGMGIGINIEDPNDTTGAIIKGGRGPGGKVNPKSVKGKAGPDITIIGPDDLNQVNIAYDLIDDREQKIRMARYAFEDAMNKSRYDSATEWLQTYNTAHAAEFAFREQEIAAAKTLGQERLRQIEAEATLLTTSDAQRRQYILDTVKQETEARVAGQAALNKFAQGSWLDLVKGAVPGALKSLGGVGGGAMAGIGNAAGSMGAGAIQAGMVAAEGFFNYLKDSFAKIFEALGGLLKETIGAVGKMMVDDKRLGGALGQAGSTAAAGAGVFGGALLVPTAWPIVPLAALGTAAAGAGMGLLKLSTETESYKKFQNAMTFAVSQVVHALEPFWRNMLPIATLAIAVARGLGLLLTPVAQSHGLINQLFNAFHLLGTASLNLLVAFEWARFTMFQITFAMMNQLVAMGAMSADSETYARAQKNYTQANADLGIAEGMLKQFGQMDLGDLPTEAEEAAKELAKMNASVTNMPSWVKVSGMRFNAADTLSSRDNATRDAVHASAEMQRNLLERIAEGIDRLANAAAEGGLTPAMAGGGGGSTLGQQLVSQLMGSLAREGNRRTGSSRSLTPATKPYRK